MTRPVPVNVVPTRRVRLIAEAMIADAEEMPGADAFLRHCSKVHTHEVPALFGLLLTATKQHKKLGRPIQPITYSEEDRRRANRQYKAGMRDEWTMTGWREYQRLSQRRRTRGLQVAS